MEHLQSRVGHRRIHRQVFLLSAVGLAADFGPVDLLSGGFAAWKKYRDQAVGGET